MASIEKRGSGYRFVVSVGIGEDQDGKKKQVKKTRMYYPKEKSPNKLQKELEREAALFEEQVISGKFLDGEKIKFADFVKRWKKDYAENNLEPSVLENHMRRLQTVFIPELGTIPLTKITRWHIQEVVNKETEKGKSQGTIKKYIAVLSGVFTRAIKWGLIDDNPCRNIDYPKKEFDFRVHTFTVEEAKIFIKALSEEYSITKKGHERTLKSTGKTYSIAEYTERHRVSLQFQCLYLILLHSGIRRGEALSLTWEDCNMEKHELNINKSTVCVNGKQVIKSPKTKAGYRKIAISETICDLLKKWKTEQQQMSLELGNLWNGYRGSEFDKNFLFIQATGEQMHLSTVTHKFREILERHNNSCKEDEKLPIIRLHDLRHTSATLLISNGIDVRATAARLGHASPSVTLNFYAEALESVDHVASDKLSEVLSV